MKSLSLIILAVLLSTQVFADGFKCEALDSDLKIKIFNKVQPSDGTRNPAVMIISDDSISFGRKTVAIFKEVEGLLSQSRQVYIGKVDHRFNNTNRKGELIGGTKIGNLKSVIVDIDFSYVYPLVSGDYTTAKMTLVRRKGEKIVSELTCERYLKN